MKKTAVLSDCQKYRYQLCRIWDETKDFVLFIGLNPSTADAEIDDRTVSRCIGFAQKLNFGGFYMANLFAYRSTRPSRMFESSNPIGADNNEWIEKSINCCKAVIVCWGNSGRHLNRNVEVEQILEKYSDKVPILCLKKNKNGQPSHPLYIASDTKPMTYLE